MRMFDRLRSWWRGRPVAPVETTPSVQPGRQRGQVTHVLMLDGTFCDLSDAQLSHVGRIFRLLSEPGPRARVRLYYEPGQRWEGWRHGWDVIQGRGLDAQIIRAYGWLASHYRPGDLIFLIGYSRGAYAVRSLAGVIDRVGLLRQEEATERNVTQVWRHYRDAPESHAARAFAAAYCLPEAPIEMMGIFDTVKSLGLRLPFLWMLLNDRTGFHNHRLGPATRHGFHALALNETRHAFAPVLWDSPVDWSGNVQQVWFRGAHADIGGQVGAKGEALPLANIPLTWMLERAETLGLPLPEDWRNRFPTDVTAPMVGTWHSWGKYFILRSRRPFGRDPSEELHASLARLG